MIANYLRLLHITVPTQQKPKDTITLQDFYNIVWVLQGSDEPIVYRAAFALSFYGFLRISNLVPATKQTFDPCRQLTRSDITFTPEGVRVFLKWAKNLQKTQQSQVIMLLSMNNHIISTYHILQTLSIHNLILHVTQ